MKVAKKVKKKLKERNGITLIALVITIIVLLILAGISIAMLAGDNSILKQVVNAKESTIKGSEQEALAVAYNGVLTNNLGSVVEGKDFTQKLQTELAKNGYNVEVTENGKIVKFKETGNVYTLDVAKGTTQGPLKEGTVGYAYATGAIKIGGKFTYSAGDVSDWIVFGEDENGNVLLASKEPIADGFTLQFGADKWLTYEDDLNTACNGFGKTVQGKTIISRSINLSDINRVTGFDKKLSEITFDKYTFGSTKDYANKQVDYYYPCAEESENEEHPYWRKATTDTLEENLEEGSTEIPAKQFEYNGYYYNVNEGEGIYATTEGNEFITSEKSVTLNNMEYIVGESGDFQYPIATACVGVSSSSAIFDFAKVMMGMVCTTSYGLCDSSSNRFSTVSLSTQYPIRPVVVLPPDLLVQETNGVYALIEQNQ